MFKNIWNKQYFPYFFIFILCLATYFLIFFNGLVDDDIAQITLNSHAHHLSGVLWSFKGSAGVYRPLMFSYFSVIYSLFGQQAFWFHFFQIVLAVANVLLVYWLFSHFFKSNIALLLCTIFLVSPVNIDAIAYVSHVADVMFLFFGLLSLVVCISKKIPRNYKFILTSLLILCSLLSKEAGLFFVSVTPIFAYLFKRIYFKTTLLACLTGLAAYLIIRLCFESANNLYVVGPVANLGLVGHLQQIPLNIWHYISNFVFPHNLAISHLSIVRGFTSTGFWLPFLFDILTGSAFYLLGRTIFKKGPGPKRSYIFFISWFLIGLLSQTQLLPIKDATWSNWWFYFPMIGLLGMIGLFINVYKVRLLSLVPALYVLVFCWLGFLIWQAILRESNFKSEIVLLEHDESVNQTSYLLEGTYGQQLERINNFPLALSHLYRATALYPKTNSWCDIGDVYKKQGNLDLADSYYKKCIYYVPDHTIGYDDEAQLLLENYDPRPALNFTKQAIKKFPKDPLLWTLLGQAYFKAGYKEQATIAFNKALSFAKAQDVQLNIIRESNGNVNYIRFQSE